jgi:hypothetical protein
LSICIQVRDITRIIVCVRTSGFWDSCNYFIRGYNILGLRCKIHLHGAFLYVEKF